MVPPARSAAFTLVELLVVITIIVILLALLTPALGKAVYQARLTECGAQMRTTATGLQAYAFDHRKFYPHRQLPKVKSDKTVTLHMLAGPQDEVNRFVAIDIRPQFKGYILINKQLNDPFVDPIDLESGGLRNNIIQGPYDMWFGWRYENQASTVRYQGMEKLGDFWEFQGRSYPYILGDTDLLWGGQANISASHPDVGPKPRLWLQTVVNEFVPVYGGNAIQSFWINYTGSGYAQRELMDLNFAWEDGSVHRMVQTRGEDERYDHVPYSYNSYLYTGFRVFIPER